jgi:hypothetical protein
MRAKAIVAQIVILAGVAVGLKVCIPRMEKARAAAAVLEREKRIETFYQSMVVQDTSRAVEATADGPAHPLRLRSSAPVDEVEQSLGTPGSQSRDFRGGLHLTWTGKYHTLEASFNNGRLYCLTVTDRGTGHGTMVFESSLYWRPF